MKGLTLIMEALSDTQDRYIQGTLARITYYNEVSGYTVGRIKMESRDDLLTIVGDYLDLRHLVGEPVILFGRYREHPDFGLQFFLKVRCSKPGE